MPRYIMKANKTDDLYVEWSTIVDAPIQWGTAADLGLVGDRKARADATGTTVIDPRWGGWEDDGLVVHNMGKEARFYWLNRQDIKAFLEALGNAADDEDAQQAALDAHARDITEDEDE